MESITIGQILATLTGLSTIIGFFAFLFKIYKQVLETNQKIEKNDILTRTNLKATKVMLDHFIEDKVGNGEFKEARAEIDDILIGKKVV